MDTVGPAECGHQARESGCGRGSQETAGRQGAPWAASSQAEETAFGSPLCSEPCVCKVRTRCSCTGPPAFSWPRNPPSHRPHCARPFLCG